MSRTLIFFTALLLVASQSHRANAAKPQPGGTTVLTSTGTLPARVESRTGNDGRSGEVVVNGIVILRLRTTQATFPPVERARIAAERLQNAVALGVRAADVILDAQTDKLNPRLKAAGFVIATSNAEEAKGTGASAGGLAFRWMTQLRQALQMPALTATVAAQAFIVPLGETRAIQIGGAARGPIFVQNGSGNDSRIVSATTNSATGDVIVTSLSKGRDTIIITREGVSVTVPVQVLPFAGTFDAPRTVTVTGTQAAAEVVARHVAAAALQSARGLPGSIVRLQSETLNVAPLAAGQRQVVNVPLQVTGDEMLPVEKTVSVGVVNTTLPPIRVGSLFYSNDPERLTGFGTLFVGRLEAREATRLLYHHQSAMNRAVWFTVELINDSDVRSVVQVVGGEAGPVRDTVWVGYRAAGMFLRDAQNDTGAFVEVPPHSRVGLTTVRMPVGQTISGLMQMRVIVGGAPLVRVAADIPGAESALPAALQPFPTTWTPADAGKLYTLSDHVYPDPVKRIAANYRVGERWQFLNIGKKPIANDGGGKVLEGNFGVTYEMAVTLENPTNKEATVQFVFDPTAGLAGAIFVIDGRYFEVPQINRNEAVLTKYVLPSGGRRNVTIRTVPLSGSNYPATLVIRP